MKHWHILNAPRKEPSPFMRSGNLASVVTELEYLARAMRPGRRIWPKNCNVLGNKLHFRIFKETPALSGSESTLPSCYVLRAFTTLYAICPGKQCMYWIAYLKWLNPSYIGKWLRRYAIRMVCTSREKHQDGSGTSSSHNIEVRLAFGIIHSSHQRRLTPWSL